MSPAVGGGVGGVAAVVRSAPSIAQDAPLGERADDAGLVRGQVRERVVEPETQAGEVLLPLGQDAGGDEELANVEGPPVPGAGRRESRG